MTASTSPAPSCCPAFSSARVRGEWTAVDLFAREIEQWAAVDPDLRLAVEDATQLSFSDESFDACLCLSVIEHVPGDGDATGDGRDVARAAAQAGCCT